MPRYISADDFQVELHNMGLIDKSGWIRASITNMNIILAKCTADASPVIHGQWIFNPKDAIEMMFTLPKCSECGAESSDCGNYCPNCGAMMDEVKEDE